MAQNDPEKKIPYNRENMKNVGYKNWHEGKRKQHTSTAAKAITRSAKDAWLALHHLSAQFAFFWTQGIVSMALVVDSRQ
jgi:hypothetical protein